MKRTSRDLIIIVIALLMLGCSSTSSQQNTNDTREAKKADLNISTQVEKIVAGHQGVADAVAVTVDENISLAIKVTGFQRLRLVQIRREVNDLIKNEFPEDYTLHLTTDKRLIRDLARINETIRANNGMVEGQTQRELEKLNKDMHG